MTACLYSSPCPLCAPPVNKLLHCLVASCLCFGCESWFWLCCSTAWDKWGVWPYFRPYFNGLKVIAGVVFENPSVRQCKGCIRSPTCKLLCVNREMETMNDGKTFYSKRHSKETPSCVWDAGGTYYTYCHNLRWQKTQMNLEQLAISDLLIQIAEHLLQCRGNRVKRSICF